VSNKHLFLNFVAINININLVYVYKYFIALISKTINYYLNFEAHILDYNLKQYDRNIFVKTIDENFLIFNKILLIKFKLINKYANNIFSKLFVLIRYIFELINVKIINNVKRKIVILESTIKTK